MLLSLLGPMPSGNVGGPDLRTPPAELVTVFSRGLKRWSDGTPNWRPHPQRWLSWRRGSFTTRPSTTGTPQPKRQWALARRLALQVLLTGRATTLAAVDAAQGDSDAQVRRLAAIAVVAKTRCGRTPLGRALHDSSGPVRYAVLSQLGRRAMRPIGAHCEAPPRSGARRGHARRRLLATDLTSSWQGNDRAMPQLPPRSINERATASGAETGGRERVGPDGTARPTR